MLGVAARIPDPAARDQFADRLAHKARVTEEVVRAEIRKAAGARKTELPAARVPTLMGQLRGAERGLLWGADPRSGDRGALDQDAGRLMTWKDLARQTCSRWRAISRSRTPRMCQMP